MRSEAGARMVFVYDVYQRTSARLSATMNHAVSARRFTMPLTSLNAMIAAARNLHPAKTRRSTVFKSVSESAWSVAGNNSSKLARSAESGIALPDNEDEDEDDGGTDGAE